jgi:four helix bundle protein
MKNFRFLKLRVYQEAKNFHRKAIYYSKGWSKEFDYLKNQLRKAALSIVLNIAEGSGKSSDNDFNRYILNSLGSTNESAACIDIAFGEKLLTHENYNELLSLALRLKNSLGSLSKRLKAESG